MRLVEQIASRGERTIDLGETMAMALAEVGRYGEAAAVQRDLVAAAEAEGMRDAAAAPGRQSTPLRAGEAVPHAVAGRRHPVTGWMAGAGLGGSGKSPGGLWAGPVL